MDEPLEPQQPAPEPEPSPDPEPQPEPEPNAPQPAPSPTPVPTPAPPARRSEEGAMASQGCGCIAFVLWSVAVLIAGVIIVLSRLDTLSTTINSLRADLLAQRITADDYQRLVTDAQGQQVLYIVAWIAIWLAGMALISFLTRRNRPPAPPEDDDDLEI